MDTPIEVPVPPSAPPVHGGYCCQCHDPITMQQAEDDGLCSRCITEAEISAMPTVPVVAPPAK